VGRARVCTQRPPQLQWSEAEPINRRPQRTHVMVATAFFTKARRQVKAAARPRATHSGMADCFQLMSKSPSARPATTPSHTANMPLEARPVNSASRRRLYARRRRSVVSFLEHCGGGGARAARHASRGKHTAGASATRASRLWRGTGAGPTTPQVTQHRASAGRVCSRAGPHRQARHIPLVKGARAGRVAQPEEGEEGPAEAQGQGRRDRGGQHRPPRPRDLLQRHDTAHAHTRTRMHTCTHTHTHTHAHTHAHMHTHAHAHTHTHTALAN
jgi:hypothetical protein